MTYFPPPPELPPRVARFRRVPPAIFPAVLGLLGLVMAWRHAVRVFGLDPALVDMAAGMVTLLFLGCATAYAVKVALRPGVIVEDSRTLPGRTGVAALAVCTLVQAALLAGRSDELATIFLVLGTVGLLVLALLVLPKRLRGTDTAGPLTPAMHLVFVGFVLIPAAATPLDIAQEALHWVLSYCTLSALIVTTLTIRPLLTGDATPPLRPLQTIHLAPPAFLASGSVLIGMPDVAAYALAWAFLVAALLLVRVRWLTEGDFSGFWSAFTFPVTGFAGALLVVSEAHNSDALRIAGGIVLVAATLYIPLIAVRVLKLWASGTLAAKTNAAIA